MHFLNFDLSYRGRRHDNNMAVECGLHGYKTIFSGKLTMDGEKIFSRVDRSDDIQCVLKMWFIKHFPYSNHYNSYEQYHEKICLWGLLTSFDTKPGYSDTESGMRLDISYLQRRRILLYAKLKQRH